MVACPGSAASTYVVIVFSAIFIPTALASATLVIVAFIKDPFTEIRTRMNHLVLSSAIASILSAHVNVMRLWHHLLMLGGENPMEKYPSSKLAFQFCHIFWFGSQFVGTFSLFSMLMLQIFDKYAVTRGISGKWSIVCKCGILLKWLIAACVGYATLHTGVGRMMMISTTQSNIIAVVSFILAYFCLFHAVKRSDDATTGDLDDNHKNNEGVTAGSEPAILHLQGAASVKFVSSDEVLNESPHQIDVERAYQEGRATFRKVLYYVCCAVIAGILLLISYSIGSLPCLVKIWTTDLSSLMMQFYVATSPIFFIFVCPRMLQAVKSVLRRGKVDVAADWHS